VKRWTAAVVAMGMAGCGYVGDPLPPALYIPRAVTDVKAVERGAEIIVDFTPPELTTEDLPFKEPPTVEIYIGPTPEPFTPEAWAQGARVVTPPIAAKQWLGQNIAIAVRSVGPSKRPSAWSNFASLTVVAPLATPENWTVQAAPNGVKISAAQDGQRMRVYRQTEGEEQPVVLATAPGREYTDTTAEFGKKYSYRIQMLAKAGDGEAESEASAAKSILFEDKFAPAPPASLAAIQGVGSVELAWDRSTEADLKGYQVYRAAEGGEFARLGDLVSAPSFRDTTAEAGKKYRYRVTAVDQAGNESAPSETVEVVAP
jgi:hypothetical protein